MLQRERKHSLIYFNDWKNQPKNRKVRVLIHQRAWFGCIEWENWVLKIWKKIFCGFLTTFWFIINFSEKIICLLKKLQRLQFKVKISLTIFPMWGNVLVITEKLSFWKIPQNGWVLIFLTNKIFFSENLKIQKIAISRKISQKIKK